MVGRWFLQVVNRFSFQLVRVRVAAALLCAFTTWCSLANGGVQASPLSAEDCAGCHPSQHEQWQQSHHAKAMQVASKLTVLGRFDGSETIYGDSVFRFFKAKERFQVGIRKQGRDTPAQIYDVPYTFGFTPLQQYLASLPKGKLQALPVAWDSRPTSDGGQRWFALESDLDWDHPGFTWNTSCADCHSTGLEKNYDGQSHSFETVWDEINVSCASCHGDGEAHQRWLKAGNPEGTKQAGFPASLAEQGQWRWLPEAAIAQREGKPAGEQLSTCAQCHSRRDKIAKWHPGTELLDHISPALVNPPLYFADGQIRDEVFVLGSFMQSRMHAAGVVCSNCHEPHSLKLRAQGDALCSQCHRAAVFAAPQHHGHAQSEVSCVDCHMPETVYMGVDARRDHRFGIPDPALSNALSSPAPCRSCHADKSVDEFAKSIAERAASHHGASSKTPMAAPPVSPALTQLFAQAQGGVASNAVRYKLDGNDFAPIRQAALLLLLDVNADPAMRAIVENKLRHADPVVRLAAVRSLSRLPLEERWRLLSLVMIDPSKAVRLEVASQLAAAKPLAARAKQTEALEQLHKQYESYLQGQLDSPTQVFNLGNYHAAQQNFVKAEALYKRALELDPEFLYPYLQLAELARISASENDAAEKHWLDAALAVAPENAELQYHIGLYWVRSDNYEAALAALASAHELGSAVENYAVTYAIALENTGSASAAINTLAVFYRQHPQATSAVELSIRYALKYSKAALAAEFLNLWLANQPNSAAARRWQQHLQQR